MVGTYVSLALVLGASYVVGQALFCACGYRERSTLAPAAGLGVLCAAAWLAADLAGSAWAGLGAIAVLVAVGLTYLRLDPPAGGFNLRSSDGETSPAVTVAVGAVLLGSIPFLVEMRFGVLGTGLNPDMSQHLFAADRIANGGEERLIEEGYPLGPHAVVASLSKIGPSLVAGFNGLSLAVMVAAALAPLGYLARLDRARRIAGALLVGFAYLAASYLIQGAFKETMQAMFLLAFVVGLASLAGPERAGVAAGGSRLWRAVPLAALATGSLYAYSFPGLAWLAGTAGVFAVAEVLRARSLVPLRAAGMPALVALAATALVAAPEVPRVLDFASFETFDPDGEGLGNLFNPISPIEALGIWPSGDFRLDPGAGFAPAIAFYAGGAVGAFALLLGTARAVRAGEWAAPAALAAGIALYAYPLLAGTPYQEAKALAIVAPVAMLLAALATLSVIPPTPALREIAGRSAVVPLAAIAFLAGAGGSSLLALVNGPVGPAGWTPALLEFSEAVEGKTTLAVLDDDFAGANGRDLAAWELRGREVCVVAESDVNEATVGGRAFEAVVVVGELSEPLPVVGRLEELAEDEENGLDYVLYRARLVGEDPGCPFVADGDRAEAVAK
jgi:hypothetical protein